MAASFHSVRPHESPKTSEASGGGSSGWTRTRLRQGCGAPGQQPSGGSRPSERSEAFREPQASGLPAMPARASRRRAPLVPEVPPSGEHHGEAVFVGCRDHFRVPH